MPQALPATTTATLILTSIPSQTLPGLLTPSVLRSNLLVRHFTHFVREIVAKPWQVLTQPNTIRLYIPAAAAQLCS